MDLRTFGQAIRELAEEKGVAETKVVETIELAIAAAYKKDYGKKGQIIRARFNSESGDLRFSQVKIVVDETMIKSEEEIASEETVASAIAGGGGEPVATPKETDEREELASGGEATEVRKVRFNPERHIMLEEARRTKPDVASGEELEFPLEARRDFGRIASQTAKQVIIQRIREAEREATYGEYKSREGEIVSGIVQRLEGRNVFVDLGRGVGLLPFEEQIPREHYAIGGRLKSLIIGVEKDTRGPGIFLSRSHPRFLKKLFELEVPEIPAGSVEIKVIAREAGSRSKVAVASNDSAIDPVGSMVGQRGVRVSTVINEIGGEKIDIIEWSDDPGEFIANALAPAKVLDVVLNGERREARAVVPDDQISLAIGKGGQNVRLAAKLTGWRIDVHSASAQAPEAAPAIEGVGELPLAQEAAPPAGASVEPSGGARTIELPAQEPAPVSAPSGAADGEPALTPATDGAVALPEMPKPKKRRVTKPKPEKT